MAQSHGPRCRTLISGLLAALLLFPAMFASPGFASPDEVAAINQAIKASRGHWKAGETSISKLSPEARLKRVGALKPPLREEEHQAAAEESAALAETLAPPNLDWRYANGSTSPSSGFVTPIRNQGSCGSCWDFATTAALESQVLLTANTPGVDLDLSEQLLLSCSNAGNCSGGYIDRASDYIRDMGLPLESCFLYTATNNTCANACPDWANNTHRIPGWHWVATTSATADALKSALVLYGPLVTTMDVYADFFSYVNGIYTHVSGAYQGGHAILLVGYDDGGQYFVAKNSWGPNWGEAGFFRIAYSQLSNTVNFGDYTIAYEGSSPVDPPPPPPPACTYGIAPSGQTFKATGGTATVTVSTQASCGWTAVSNADWISVTSGSSGSGSGTVALAVQANLYATQRSATVTIAGQTFTVKQSGSKNRKAAREKGD